MARVGFRQIQRPDRTETDRALIIFIDVASWTGFSWIRFGGRLYHSPRKRCQSKLSADQSLDSPMALNYLSKGKRGNFS